MAMKEKAPVTITLGNINKLFGGKRKADERDQALLDEAYNDYYGGLDKSSRGRSETASSGTSPTPITSPTSALKDCTISISAKTAQNAASFPGSAPISWKPGETDWTAPAPAIRRLPAFF